MRRATVVLVAPKREAVRMKVDEELELERAAPVRWTASLGDPLRCILAPGDLDTTTLSMHTTVSAKKPQQENDLDLLVKYE